jgi:uncharacterized protein YndB with AHSA1/START domain
MTSLTLVRRIRARPETVFELLTSAAGMAEWWGPDAGPVLHAESEPRVGGRFRVRFRQLDGSEEETNGEFLEVQPPWRAVMSWWWTGGSVDPGVSRVEITLRQISEGTELTVFHSQLDNEESRRRHEEGWVGALDNVEAALASAART